MGVNYILKTLFCITVTFFYNQEYLHCHARTLDKKALKEQVVEMFNHAYNSYMTYAYPADELMPLSCKGRVRGEETSRGDIDDALGRFSLTLIDTLDTLAVLGELDKFEEAVQLVIQDVSFDTDIVVSVFETNIRVLGGLLGGHVMALEVKERTNKMQWYGDELLTMAKDIGYRLLPAFNTSTGMPYPRVNLKYGIHNTKSRTGTERDTCTACAGTMILEFAALSRLTGISIFEEKAHRAMQYIWGKRHRSNNLVGTTINIHNGDWVRRESGVGAGIDSYYEYCLKAYILLGEEIYLDRFNKHYDAIMRYVSNGPLLIDVHMHKPLTKSKNFMDALLAFWPGLQVLVGDIKPAMETHEMLYQVTKKHKFLPEAFTVDHNVYWGQHPLRPEFVESTFFLYKATGDAYYLEVGKNILDNLNQHARVPCGFAGMKDVRTGSHEDRMDSFVLAETFKYLYLLFAESDDVIIKLDDYIFTTEAHLLPLYIGNIRNKSSVVKNTEAPPDVVEYTMNYDRTCPNHNYKQSIEQFADLIRKPSQPQSSADEMCSQTYRTTFNMPKRAQQKEGVFRAIDFIPGNKEHEMLLKKMGIRLVTMRDGRVQLLHTASQAATPEDAEEGMVFMQDMIELSKVQSQEEYKPRAVQLISSPYLGSIVLTAGPAQFGMELHGQFGVYGETVVADPFRACAELYNAEEFAGRIVVMERGDCMFIDKARNIQKTGAIGAIIIDNNEGSSSDMSSIFAMSGDGSSDITMAAVFLFWKEGKILLDAIKEHDGHLEVMLVDKAKPIDDIIKEKQREAESETLEESAATRGQQEHSVVFDPSKTSGPELSDDLVDAIMDEVQRMVRGEGGMAEYIKELEETQRDLKRSGYNVELEFQFGGEEENKKPDPGTLEVDIDLSQESEKNGLLRDLQQLRKYLKESVKMEQGPSGVEEKSSEEDSEIQNQAQEMGLQAPPQEGVEEEVNVDEQQLSGQQHTVQPTPVPEMQPGMHGMLLQPNEQLQQQQIEPQHHHPQPARSSVGEEHINQNVPAGVHVQLQHESQMQQEQQRGQSQQHSQHTATPQGASQHDVAEQQHHQTQQQAVQQEQQQLHQQHIHRHQLPPQQQQQQQHQTSLHSQQPQPEQGRQFQDPLAKQETLEMRQREHKLQQQLAQEKQLKMQQLRQEQLQQQMQKNLAMQREQQHLQGEEHIEKKDEL